MEFGREVQHRQSEDTGGYFPAGSRHRRHRYMLRIIAILVDADILLLEGLLVE